MLVFMYTQNEVIMSRRSVHRGITREEKRAAKLAKIVPQLTAKDQARINGKTSKHRGQKLT